jgi:Ca2+-binding RTX toxin-like protein
MRTIGMTVDLNELRIAAAISEDQARDVVAGRLASNNTIPGSENDDRLVGFDGDDLLLGEEGSDTLIGGAGSDIIDGGNQDSLNDFASYETATSGVVVNLSNPSANRGDAFGDQYLNIEGIIGSDFGDLLIGSEGRDILVGGKGNDTFVGSAGRDYFIGGDGIDTVNYAHSGGPVQVSLTGGGELGDALDDRYNIELDQSRRDTIENLIGSSFKDSLRGNDLSNLIEGGAGDDNLLGVDGNDTLDGGTGNDHMQGMRDDDTYIVDSAGDYIVEDAGNGIDTIIASVSYALEYAEVEVMQAASGIAPINLTGNRYTTTLIGNEGSNVLDGRGAANQMHGGGGNDVYIVDNAFDVVADTSGYDVAYASTSFIFAASSGIDKIIATGAAASLTGNDLSNEILATGFANTIDGGVGNDTIYGKGGKDVLIGGAGSDRFVFDTKFGKSNIDRIKDFKVKHDKILLEADFFKKSKPLYNKIKKATDDSPKSLSKSFFTIDSKAKDKDDYLVYNKKTGVLSYDADGSAKGKAVEIAQLSKNLKLSASDFLFI